jgi:tol-pal system protein YbgF
MSAYKSASAFMEMALNSDGLPMRLIRHGVVGWAMSLLVAGALGGVLGGALQPALAQQQDLRPLWDRIQRMERDLTTLQQQTGTGGRPASGGGAMDAETAASATVRMAQLESDLRTTTGQLEEINFSVGQMRQRLDRLVTDVDFRLGELEKIARGEKPAAVAEARPAAVPGSPASTEARVPAAVPGAVAGAEGPAPSLGLPPRDLGTIPLSVDRTLPSNAGDGSTGVPPGPAAGQVAAMPGQIPPTAIAPGSSAATPAIAPANVRLPPGSSKDQYDYAFDLLKRAEYAQAEQALRQFVTAYPGDPLAGNAQYWLAETYYVRNNYTEAAAQFLKGYQAYPQSPKAADNLFKLGVTLTILGKTQEACTAFQRFDREYASAPGVLKRRVGDERQRLGCG